MATDWRAASIDLSTSIASPSRRNRSNRQPPRFERYLARPGLPGRAAATACSALSTALSRSASAPWISYLAASAAARFERFPARLGSSAGWMTRASRSAAIAGPRCSASPVLCHISRALPAVVISCSSSRGGRVLLIADSAPNRRGLDGKQSGRRIASQHHFKARFAAACPSVAAATFPPATVASGEIHRLRNDSCIDFVRLDERKDSRAYDAPLPEGSGASSSASNVPGPSHEVSCATCAPGISLVPNRSKHS